ncbi:ABC transporter ATP-binding protein [Agrococcus carbonis]|uniref:NitT/TauT family transport system ATP-binding protein n=1 Tax=Agrococcus carbonis TaxID=684552 RepID=A0A1H1NJE6_9MICO|nr:ABC transporter ATP-binding protein [Agrococcus carbonis]SDR99114.1 NitT/TauT family transport system ATP-binding protein [Agrococcus carbonis]
MTITDRADAPTQAPAISLRGVSKTFDTASGPVHALQDIDLDIQPGSFVSLIGPSGCGKSTLLRVIGDLIDPSEGVVEVHGKSASAARKARDYGMVFQQAGLMDWRTVRRNIELPLQVQNVGREERRAKAREMLQLVKLEQFEHHRPRQLSGGMQQRVAIARALSFQPRVLLMDEPLGALDEMTREHMQRHLLGIYQETGTTVVFVTHSVSEAAFLSTDVIVMSPRPGRIAERLHIDLPRYRNDETRVSEQYFAEEAKVREALHSVLDESRSAA